MAKSESRVVDVEVTARAQRQDAELAMGSDPINAIVELVTNCDDAYLAMNSARREKIRIQVDRHRRAPTTLVVKDRAGGMSAAELEQRLGKMGERTSGFETGAERRGLFGRGAKDIVHFGPARWESVKAGVLSFFELLYDGRFTGKAKVGVLGSAPQGRRGTTATLHVQPRFRVPRHETLLQKLRNHYALRPLLLDSNGREVTLSDESQDRSDKIRFEPPKAVLLEEVTRSIPGFDGQHVDLRLYEASEPLSEEGEDREYWRHSILITSGRAAYEMFDGGRFSREPDASHLRRIYGYASVPGINELIRAFDDAEEGGATPDDQNPLRLVRRDRRGLAGRRDHPFVDALYTVLEEVLAPHLERLRKAAEEAEGEVSEETRRRWDRAGRELAKLMDEDSGGDGSDGSLPPPGLSVIPTVRPVEPGEAARLLVRFRPSDAEEQADPVAVEVVEADEDGPHAPVSLVLEPRTGYFSRTYTVAGREEGAMSDVVVRAGVAEASALVQWRHRPPTLVEQLEFESARFSIKDGQERRVVLVAPWAMITEIGDQAQFKIEGDSSISLPQGLTGVFTHDEARDAGICRIRVRGQRVGARARLTASLGEDIAETELIVTSTGVSGIKIEFTDADVDQRAWLNMEEGRIYVNTNDPTVRRYVGPKNKGRPGQNSVPFNVMLAEVMVDAAARHQLQRQETEVRDAVTLFGRQLALTKKWLPRIHRALVPEGELRAVRNW